MSYITAEARTALDLWYQENALLWEQDGADADEIREDIENHLQIKHHGRNHPLNLEDINGILIKMEMPSLSPFDQTINPKPLPISKTNTPLKKEGLWKMFFKHISTHWFWLTLWPLLIILLELITGMSGSMFFDSMPSWYHITTVIYATAIGVYHFNYKLQNTNPSSLHSFLRYTALIISGYWSLIMIPVILSGFLAYGTGLVFTAGIGIIAFPFFIICLLIAGAPMLLFIGLLRKGSLQISKFRGNSSSILGAIIGLIIILLLEGPTFITHYGVDHDNPSIIRTYGSEKTLLRLSSARWSPEYKQDIAGYLTNFSIDEFFNMMPSSQRHDPSKARKLYYRVTGSSFNNPSTGSFRSRSFEFDGDLGGDSVSAKVADLDMSSSRMDGHIDKSSGLGYWEWTMEFSNTGSRAKEARMQVLLPPDGVVSRLTLWVNGEPQEAAFASKEKVTKAYKAIAVVRRQDPVLVRWLAPDRVLVQCFPVPADGKMKIRLGVTAALDDKQRLYLPRIIEQNFGLGKKQSLSTNIWIQGDTDLEMKGLPSQASSGKWKENHGQISAKTLSEKHSFVQAHGDIGVQQVWTTDPFTANQNNVLLREISTLKKTSEEAKEVVVIVDASSGNADYKEPLIDALRSLQKKHALHIVTATEEEVLEGIESLEGSPFAGGQDNNPALLRGLEIAQEKKSTHLIWLHGTQPEELSSDESISQLLERSFHKPKILTVDLGGGINRVLENLSSEIRIHGQARPAEANELNASIQHLLQAKKTTETWTAIQAEDIPENATKVWDQLARWRVWREIQAAKHSKDLIQRASAYQLVTSVSGAVVLETKAQYKEFDLTQAELSTVPSIPATPEPSTILMLTLGATSILFRRKRKSRFSKID